MSDDLFAVFGVMGGFMQPQGHVQVLQNLLERRMDPQAALDAPRFCICPSTPSGSLQDARGLDGPNVAVHLEAGFSDDLADDLAAKGHTVVKGVASYDRKLFGRGQVIVSVKPDATNKKRKRDADADPAAPAVLWAGSDGRGDGNASGF